MTLKQLIDAIAKLAIDQKCIQYSAAGTSIYQLNPKSVDAYPVLFQSPTGEHIVTDNYTTYSITLYYLNGYSIKEIAAITDTKEGAVKQQLSRGRDKLKARLQL